MSEVEQGKYGPVILVEVEQKMAVRTEKDILIQYDIRYS
jgi:hypothetical protein